ncbi:hypothetical protein RYA99_24580, partial [Pseudomonas syringae pv. actinidifoliorum]|nr:hypothetical protein [Pseudomonas syringae pv. actinidifoliorum]MDU8522739.1 hypothetical protein [Pseudomonas syringae pv. actinidifoliorum]MDU8529336.1 hypothetical protein [Pseudomonas syringae pv. actinidifoliorum]
MTNIPIGLIGLFIMVPMILNLIATAVIAHKYVEIIEEQLPNCSSVQTIREAWSGGGLLGKVMRGGVISIVLMVPKLRILRSTHRAVADSRTFPKISRYLLKN